MLNSKRTMRYFLTFLTLFVFTYSKGQKLLNKIYDPNCIEIDSSNSVYSTFDKLSFNLPIGWQGEFSGDNPALYARKQVDSISFQIEAHRAYDSTGDIFQYYQKQFNDKTFEILTINGKKLLVEYKPKRNLYSIRFHPNLKKSLWLWTIEVNNANGQEDIVKCDFSKIVNEFINKLSITPK